MGKGLRSRIRSVSIVASFAIMAIFILPPATAFAGNQEPGAPRTPSASYPDCPDNNVYFWYAGPDGNSGMVIDASGFNIPTNAITWPYNGGNNQYWCDEVGSAKAPNGETYFGSFFIAYYNNTHVCLDVSGQHFVSKNPIIAYPCTYGYNELFNIDAEPYTNTYSIAPVYDPSLCLNASGGISKGTHIILWACEAVDNEYWSPVTS